jgi:3-hydroxyisobutyrate dehydrogenase
VIGIGTMGAAMTGRLLSAGIEVDVWSRNPDASKVLVDLGATAHDEASEAVASANVVVTMLPTVDSIEEVMFDRAVVDAMGPNATWVQMATIGVAATERFAQQCALRRPDVTFVDAPVSGSREPAESGELLILASGAEDAHAPLEPIFSAIGRRTMWLGAVGAGSAMKLILNTWLAFQVEGAAECSALAEAFGVDPESVFDALGDSPLASRYALAKLRRMVDDDLRADFSLEWALKDLDLVASDGGTIAAPVAGAIAERWRDLVEGGSGRLDVSAARRGLGPSSSKSS